MADLYDWERSVRDKDGEKVVIGLRDLKMYVDVQQKNRLAIFTPAETAEFAAIVAEAAAEVARRAQASETGMLG
jgi:hypothetical protein